MDILKKITKGFWYLYRSLFFSGILFILVIFKARPLDDALEEFEHVMSMNFWDGIIQMFLNNEKYY